MMKRYYPDILSLIVIAAFAFLIAGRPAVDLTQNRAGQDRGVPRAAGTETEHRQAGPSAPSSTPFLQERNIFAESGGYAATVAANQSIPENPYRLIGILSGKEKKAIFRDYTGAVIAAPVGKKMVDGFEVVVINNIFVKLQRDQEKKELRLFNAAEATQQAAIGREKTAPPSGYTLIGILGGREQKAVLRTANGALLILPAGAALADGSVISSINSLSVKLKRADGEKELRLFDAGRTLVK